MRASAVARVLQRVVIHEPGGCWTYTGHLNEKGYGRITRAGATRMTHRVTYEALVGPVPDGRELDHLCRNRACCNPAHLEVVTHRENCLRGDTIGARNARKTHCPQGHAYTPDNTYIWCGGRRCKTCTLARVRSARQR